jgi:hypothetical protein
MPYSVGCQLKGTVSVQRLIEDSGNKAAKLPTILYRGPGDEGDDGWEMTMVSTNNKLRATCLRKLSIPRIVMRHNLDTGVGVRLHKMQIRRTRRRCG